MFFSDLIKGLSVTLKHLFKRPITLRYPEQKWDLPDSYRGFHRIDVDKETIKTKCKGCCLCAWHCPANTIKIVTSEGDDFQKQVDSFEIDHTRCIYCGLCIDACPEDAIKMTKEYEISFYDKKELIVKKEDLER